MRLRMTQTWLRGAIFPITVFAFCAVGVHYANFIFTSSTRWLFLAILGLMIIQSGRIFGIISTRYGTLILLYCAWALLTSVWSIVPQLSLAKGIASISVILIFAAAGRYWASGWTTVRPVYFLTPVVVASLASTFGGVTEYAGRGLEIYQGIAGNPNLLGFLAATSFPPVVFLVYRAFSRRTTLLLRLFSVVAILILVVLLWRSASRSGIACALCVVGFSLLALRASKWLVIAMLALNIVTIVAVFAPEMSEKAYERIVLKNASEEDIFFSRREPWRESWEGAVQGGWIGLGYGASYGDSEFSMGLTASGYGREKGNSQLAILEEIGIVGGVLYGLLILTILLELISGFRRAPAGELKMELAVLIGLIFGLLVQSIVEAWWTAPGSSESAVFWATVGVASGLSRQVARTRAELAGRKRAQFAFQGAMPHGVRVGNRQAMHGGSARRNEQR